MVKLSVFAVIFTAVASVAADGWCQCLFQDGSHCFVTVSQAATEQDMTAARADNYASNMALGRTARSAAATTETTRPSVTPMASMPMSARGTPSFARPAMTTAPARCDRVVVLGTVAGDGGGQIRHQPGCILIFQ